MLPPDGCGLGAAIVKRRLARAAVGMQVLLGLLYASQRETESQLQHLAWFGWSAPHQTEGAQRGWSNSIEVQPGAARHQAPVVPQQLPPIARVALQVHCQRDAFYNDFGLGYPGCDGLDVCTQWNRCTVRNCEAAHREIDHWPGVLVGWKGVA